MTPTLLDGQFARLRRLLAEAAGLVFDVARRESLAYSVAERVRATGARDVEGYLDRLADPVERQALLDEVTIQETSFFRNPPQMRALRAHVLPELVRTAAASRRLRIWSAGCSTGEEPYTLAMLLRELLPSTSGWDVRVLGTDVSQRALAAARRGEYGDRAVHLATPEQRARFFTRQDGRWRVRPEVRDLVELRHHNLVTEPVPLDGPVDLVLCRNVTIYFDRDTTRSLMGRLHGALRDGGYLLLGHSETLWQVSQDFRLVSLGSGDDAAFLYRRLDGPGPPGDRRRVLPDRRTAVEAVPGEQRQAARRASERSLPPPVAVPVPRAVGGVPEARAALAAGRYDEAAALAGAVVAGEPLHAVAHYLLGLALVNLGRDADALVALRGAVYADPSAGLPHFLLAAVLDRLGDRVAAAREYRAAVQTLGLHDSDGTAAELGGRRLADLVALCARRAEEMA